MSPSTIVIDANADFDIDVIEREDIKSASSHDSNDEVVTPIRRSTFRDGGNEPPIAARVTFKVCKHVLKNMPSLYGTKATFFEQLLRKTGFADSGMDTVVLNGDSIAALEVILRVFHGCATGDMDTVAHEELWNIQAACAKYNIDTEKLDPWFEEWYAASEKPESLSRSDWERRLLYPCWAFDHSQGFQRATEYLAYNETRHITEKNPTSHKHLHLPPRVIQQLNAARGRLKSILHRGLWAPAKMLLKAQCTCRKETLFDYEHALFSLGVWPLEDVWSTCSVQEIMQMLAAFDFKPETKICGTCSGNWLISSVRQATASTASYFDGLCLDDMERSLSSDDDGDYWEHDREREWDLNCRIKHGKPTWYYSFMGRRELMRHQRERRAR